MFKHCIYYTTTTKKGLIFQDTFTSHAQYIKNIPLNLLAHPSYLRLFIAQVEQGRGNPMDDSIP